MYNHPKGSEKFSIKELGISYTELESLLVLYQGRFYKFFGKILYIKDSIGDHRQTASDFTQNDQAIV
jgi:hypothetical protein